MTPDEIEERLGRLLAVGTTFSTGLLAVSLALWLIVGGRPFVDRILHAGLVVLIATPVARVATSTAIYLVQRDWHMVLMTGLVLLSLALSVVVATHS
jgi:uncharacterized membrane protein